MTIQQALDRAKHAAATAKHWLLLVCGLVLAVILATALLKAAGILSAGLVRMVPSFGFTELAYACGCYWLLQR